MADSFLPRYGARVEARWEAVACAQHDRVIDLRPIPIWWPYILDVTRVLRHLQRCPCHRHDAARCSSECASRGEGCTLGPLTQLEVGRLMEMVGKHQPTLTAAGTGAAARELTRRLMVDGVPLEQIVDVPFLLAACGYEDEAAP